MADTPAKHRDFWDLADLFVKLGSGVINDLRRAHQEEGLAAPAAERLAGDYRSAVRYFHEDDRAKAEAVAARSTRFFQEKNCALVIRAEPVASLPPSRVPLGRLELWINHSCR
jgi:hypothetical protein